MEKALYWEVKAIGVAPATCRNETIIEKSIKLLDGNNISAVSPNVLSCDSGR